MEKAPQSSGPEDGSATSQTSEAPDGALPSPVDIDKITDKVVPARSEHVEARESFVKDFNRVRNEARDTLKRSTRLRLGVMELGSRAMSWIGLRVAEARNDLGAPRREFHAARRSLAERRLQKRRLKHNTKTEVEQSRFGNLESQLDAYNQMRDEADQQWIESATSSKIREHREEVVASRRAAREKDASHRLDRLTARHDRRSAKRQTKIDNYARNKVDPRREKHQSIVDVHESRIEAAQQGKFESEATVHRNREVAIAMRQAAIARKELRHEMRQNQGSDRHETAAILGGIPAEDLLRLGALIAERNRAETDTRDAERGHKRAVRTLERTKKSIADGEQRSIAIGRATAANRKGIVALQQQLAELRAEVPVSDTSDEDGFVESTLANNREDIAALELKIQEHEQVGADLIAQRNHLEAVIDAAKDRIPALEAAVTSEAEKLRASEWQRELSRGHVNVAVEDVLGIDTASVTPISSREQNNDEEGAIAA